MSTTHRRLARRLTAAGLGLALTLTTAATAVAADEENGAVGIRAQGPVQSEDVAAEAGLTAPVVTAPATATTSDKVTISWTAATASDLWGYAVWLDGQVLRFVGPDVLSIKVPLLAGANEIAVSAWTWSGVEAVSDPVTVTVSGPRVQQFSDVKTTHNFYEEIFWLSQAGVTQGYKDGTFRPANSVNRDAMAAFLYRFAGAEFDEYLPPTKPIFVDVPTSHQFYTEISWLAETGITTGYVVGGKRYYKPTSSVNRDAMAAFLFRLAEWWEDPSTDGYVAPKPSWFSDVRGTHPFYTEIHWLAEMGISTGYPDGTFRPGVSVKRDAMAAFLSRY
jgi:hypothetical protein